MHGDTPHGHGPHSPPPEGEPLQEKSHGIPTEKVDDDAREELLRLAAEAAHQIKSPLSTIQLLIETVMGGFAGPLSARQRWMLEKARERCGYGVKLVRDLMRLRSLAAIDDASLGPVNLLAIFQGLPDRFRETATERGVELRTTSDIDDSGVAWMHGDTGLVLEVVAVLVDNALKYTPRGGTVSARLYREPAADDRPAMLVVEVIDTGIGIPPEGYEHLFREFYRAPSAKRLAAEGSGLGLAFAFRAARRLGGLVHLEPASTGGVRALVSFPFCEHCADAEARLASDAAAAEAALANERELAPSRRVVVVGGVAAGSKAAAKIMRLDSRADVSIVERGRFLAYSGCGLPYYVSGIVTEQRALLETPLGALRDSSFFHQLKNVRTHDLTEAVAIDRARKVVRVRHVIDKSERELPYDQLVLATGSRAVVPEIPGVDLPGLYTLHGVEDAEAIRSELRPTRVKDVVIVGGGLLGCQITEAVALRGARITLVEQNSEILSIVDPEIGLLAARHLESHGVRVLTDARVREFAGEERVTEVVLEDGRRLGCDFALLAAGIQPESALAAAAGLEIGPTGAIAVDRCMRTTDPDIYAVGDCSEHPHLVAQRPVWIPGAAPATIQGRVAAVNICGGHDEYPGTVGTIIIKLFDCTIARTGLTERQARDSGFDPVSVLVPGPDRAHFVPQSQTILLKLIADRATRRLLGAQGFGAGEVSKRMDVVAAALGLGATVDQLAHLTLSYAPPYSMAMDVEIAAANVLRNKLDGHFDGISPRELRETMIAGQEPELIDVRLPSEFNVVRMRGSKHVPLGTLRSRFTELPRDKPIVLVCKMGLRSYEASLILRSHGFTDVRVLDGGLDGWPYGLERLT